VSARWIDLVDPTAEELHAALPAGVDPEVVEALLSAAVAREPRPLLESHGRYVFGVLVATHPVPDEDRVAYAEIDLVTTTDLVVTVRKSPRDGDVPFDPAGLLPLSHEGAEAGVLVHRLVDEVADSFVTAVDAVYGEIEELEDSIDTWPPRRVRERISALRHELLRTRRTVSATRAAVRRILDGRVEIGEHALFPASIEVLFGNTYETLVRVTDELDIARDLLAGVRDHHQSKVTETQGEVVKKLTVIASLVLVPSLIVGFYGQNFGPAFDEGYWSLAVSGSLIAASTVAQLVLYRWRRWI
jgi:magnesium transporter